MFFLTVDTAQSVETLVRSCHSVCRRGGGICFLIFLLLRVWYDSKLTRSLFFSSPLYSTRSFPICLRTPTPCSHCALPPCLRRVPGLQLQISGNLRTSAPLKGYGGWRKRRGSGFGSVQIKGQRQVSGDVYLHITGHPPFIQAQVFPVPVVK